MTDQIPASVPTLGRTRLERAQNAYTFGKTLYDQGKSFYRTRQAKHQYFAVVSETDFIYPAVLAWLEGLSDGRHVRFRSTYNMFERHYDGRGTNHFNLGGHKIEFSLKSPSFRLNGKDEDGPESEAGIGTDSLQELASRNIQFAASSKAAIDALEVFLREMHAKTKDRPVSPKQWFLSRWGWDYITSPNRKLESVFLPEGMMESVVTDIRMFVEDEERYAKIGMPWHRGYLFSGPPGNGKSSFAAALATEFEFNLYDLPLSSVPNDKDLADRFHNVEARSILLLEDIDIFSKSMRREQEKDAPTLAGLLNCLDGVNTPHGLIVIMSTNHREVLDDALTRKGRVDMDLEFLAPTAFQTHRFFEHVYDEPLGVAPRQFKNTAELAEIMKTHRNADDARLEIKAE